MIEPEREDVEDRCMYQLAEVNLLKSRLCGKLCVVRFLCYMCCENMPCTGCISVKPDFAKIIHDVSSGTDNSRYDVLLIDTVRFKETMLILNLLLYVFQYVSKPISEVIRWK